MKTIKLFLAIAVVALIFTACGKDGDKGATGATGPAGAPGPQGPVGQTGAANVKSYLFTNPATISFSGAFDQVTLTFGGTFDVPLATRDNGIILVYALYDNGNNDVWQQIPGYILTADYQVVSVVNTVAIVLQALTKDFNAIPGNPAIQPLKLKVVAVPPGTVVNLKSKEQPDPSHYNATMDFYGLSR